MTARGNFIGIPGKARSLTPGIPVYVGTEQIGEVQSPMSLALWCDKGDHAFSSKDPLKQHFTQTQDVQVPTGNSYGTPTYQQRQQVTEELDICGPCWSKTNPFSPNRPDPVKELERKSEDWEEGYDAGINHATHTKPMTDGA